MIDEEVKGDPSLFPTPEVEAEPVHRSRPTTRGCSAAVTRLWTSIVTGG